MFRFYSNQVWGGGSLDFPDLNCDYQAANLSSAVQILLQKMEHGWKQLLQISIIQGNLMDFFWNAPRSRQHLSSANQFLSASLLIWDNTQAILLIWDNTRTRYLTTFIIFTSRLVGFWKQHNSFSQLEMQKKLGSTNRFNQAGGFWAVLH